MLKQVQHDNVGIATRYARNDSLGPVARNTTVIARSPSDVAISVVFYRETRDAETSSA